MRSVWVLTAPKVVCPDTNTLFNYKPFFKKRIEMIIVPVKEGENIERALKKFKRKSEKTGVIKEVRNRKQFNKPSVVKRIKMQHAVYVNKLHLDED